MKDFQGFTKDGIGPEKETDYRKEIMNMSKQFPNQRFGQFIFNVLAGNDMFFISDEKLHEKCKSYCALMGRN